MKNMAKALSLILVIAMITVFAASCGTPKTVETYLQSEEGKESIESVKESFEDTYDIEIYAKGNDMYYDYTYLTQFDDDTVEILKDTLVSGLEAQASTFETVIETMEEEVEGEVTLTVIYRNADDTVLAEKTFK